MLNLQESCKSSPKNSHVLFIQVPPNKTQVLGLDNLLRLEIFVGGAQIPQCMAGPQFQ